LKSKIAVFDLASCEGSELQIANNEERIIDLVQAVNVVSFREAMKNQGDVYYVALIAGLIQCPGTAGSRSLGDSRAKNELVLDHAEDTPKCEV
jgi:coenzyme F420-reducing hydrogenase gamma subunit